jgi:hypothetical protein
VIEGIINYSLNKFCPLLLIAFILFFNFGYLAWEPYVTMGLVLFVDRFNFKTGYAVAFCEARGVDING